MPIVSQRPVPSPIPPSNDPEVSNPGVCLEFTFESGNICILVPSQRRVEAAKTTYLSIAYMWRKDRTPAAKAALAADKQELTDVVQEILGLKPCQSVQNVSTVEEAAAVRDMMLHMDKDAEGKAN